MIHIHDILSPERSKYEAIWAQPDYHEFSPGMQNVERFMEVIEPKRGDSLIDLGCGSGKAGLAFEEHGLKVSWMDLTDAALDEAVDHKRFTNCAIWERLWMKRRPMGWDYGFCCDVLEHLPTEFTMLAIDRITRACRTSWFQIAFEPDARGVLIGQHLHLTVEPFTWWRDRLSLFGKLVEARDLCGAGMFVVKQ